jgi:uncharacterized protein (TIGR02452 family)
MNREQRVQLAEQTVEIIECGEYISPSGRTILIADEMDAVIKHTKLYRPDDFPEEVKVTGNEAHTTIEVTDESTLEAAFRLVNANHDSRPLCLNFASARNPGGGFLGGSQAQEESLARSSGLYASLTSQMEMYEFNRRERSLLYSDHMIYSPDVPVFRDDAGRLLESPYLASFITAPAVNAGAVKKNEPQSVKLIQSTMATRLQRLLWVAMQHQHKTLVLGAWGCGVFQNSPAMVAALFAEMLGANGMFRGCFNHIVYAIYDRGENQEVLRTFQNILKDQSSPTATDKIT